MTQELATDPDAPAPRAEEGRRPRVPGIAAWEWDVAEDRLHWSPENTAIFGLEAPPVSVDGFLASIHPEDRVALEGRVTSFLDNADSFEHQFRVVRPDGEVRHVLDRGLVQRDAAGAAVRLIGFNVDLTEQKRLEELARSAERRATVAARIGGLVTWETDVATRETVYDAGLPELFGLTGKPDAWALLERVHPDDRAAHVAAFEQAVTPGGRFTHEYRVPAPDGGWRRLRMQGEHVETADGPKVVGFTVDVTERHEAWEALRRSEERLNFALEAGGAVGAWDWSVSEDRMRTEALFAKLFGVSPEEAARGVPLSLFIEAIHVDDRPRIEAAVARAVETCGEYEEEYRIVVDGVPERWVLARGRCYPGPDGRPDRFPGVAVDITERKRQEAELAHALSLIDGIAQGANDLIAALDDDFRFLFFNDAYRREYQSLWGADVALGSSLIEPLAAWPEQQAQAREIWTRALAGETFNVVMAFGPTAEETRTYDLRFSPVIGRDGRRIGAAHIFRDITEQVRLEQALRESEARFRHVAAAIPGLMYIGTPEGENLYVNEGFSAYTGLPSEELLGFGWTKVVHPDDLDRAKAGWSSRVAHAIGGQAEYRVRGADGVYRWFLSNTVPHFDSEGRVVSCVGTAADIDARKAAERQRELLIAELNHRVKNTLAIVQAVAIQSLRDQTDPGEARRAFEARLKTLAHAHDMLTETSCDRIDLRDLVERAVSPFDEGARRRIVTSGPNLKLDPSTAVSFALGLHELATNAIKYGALSAETGEVVIDWTVDETGPDAARMTFRWTERGGPPVSAPTRRGFGSRLVERALAADLGGRATLDFAPDGLVCVIEAPV